MVTKARIVYNGQVPAAISFMGSRLRVHSQLNDKLTMLLLHNGTSSDIETHVRQRKISIDHIYPVQISPAQQAGAGLVVEQGRFNQTTTIGRTWCFEVEDPSSLKLGKLKTTLQ